MNTPDGLIIRCGRPTRRGHPCRLPLRAGTCPTHDYPDLAARNAKVTAAWRAKNPDGFTAQRRRAGRKGYEKVGGRVWWAEQTDKARLWRRQHPSEPERWVADLLIAHTLESYDTEYVVDGDPRAVDFAFPEHKLAIEVNGHQDAPSFGEAQARVAKHAAKVAWLQALGWTVHVVNAKDDRTEEARRLVEFLRVHQLES